MKKTINVNGKAFNFETNASVPRVYRRLFNRDLFKDISALQKLDKSNIVFEKLEPIENIAFTFAYLADKNILTGSVDESVENWISQFEGFELYTDLAGELMEMWVGETESLSKEIKEAKKSIGS